MTQAPPFDETKVRAFEASARKVNFISLALGLYIFLVLFPAYVLLRWVWAHDQGALSGLNIFVGLLTALLFALFARWTMRHYLGLK